MRVKGPRFRFYSQEPNLGKLETGKDGLKMAQGNLSDRSVTRWLVLALSVVALAAMPLAASAQDCNFHALKADFTSAVAASPGVYDGCMELTKVTGTLNGSYRVCWYNDEVVSSDEVFSDGNQALEAAKYYSSIETKHGTVDFVEWAWFDNDFGIEVGQSKVTGGTGEYAGAFGLLRWTLGLPNIPSLDLEFDGYICTP
jgi:hypothetical protein